jgi:hypothetical protein
MWKIHLLLGIMKTWKGKLLVSCELAFTPQHVATPGVFHPAVFLLASPQHPCVLTMPPSRTQNFRSYPSRLLPLSGAHSASAAESLNAGDKLQIIAEDAAVGIARRN